MVRYRQGNIGDLDEVINLINCSWSKFKNEMETSEWVNLERSLANESTFRGLLTNVYSVVCLNEMNEIIGVSFVVGRGNPTEIFDEDWSYIRFLSVDPMYRNQSVGRQLMKNCIQHAKDGGERIIALHTSEMMDSARKLYEDMGFINVKELEPRFGKRYWLYKMMI